MSEGPSRSDVLAMRTRIVAQITAVVAGLGVVLGVIGAIEAASSDDAPSPAAAPAAAVVPTATAEPPEPAPTEEPEEARAEDRSEPLSDRRFNPRAIYKREAPGVVTVVSIFPGGSLDRLLGGQGGGAGQGSGFVIDGNGEIATNAHVITSGEKGDIKVAKEIYVEFADGNIVPAKVVGQDPNSDIALIKVDPKGLDLDPLPLGRSDRLVVGSPVVAIGSPFGQAQSLSVGVVSALGRSISSLTDFSISDAIQTDAAINKGNSGGPLVDARGRVIGVNSQINSATGDGTGVGFAVPIDTVKTVLSKLRAHGKIDYAFLGVSSTDIYPQLAKRFKLPVRKGAWLQTVAKDGPAAKAGLRAGDKKDELLFQARRVIAGGDIIVGVAGEKVRGAGDLSDIIAKFSPGDSVEVEVYRGAKRQTVKVKLGARPAGG